MIKIYKDNMVISINEPELEYYKNLGYKKVGEKETVEKTVSSTVYQELVEKEKDTSDELEDVKKQLAAKDVEIAELVDELEDVKSQLIVTDDNDNSGEGDGLNGEV